MYTVFNLKPILIEKAFVISPEGLKLFLSLIDWYKLGFFFFYIYIVFSGYLRPKISLLRLLFLIANTLRCVLLTRLQLIQVSASIKGKTL